MEPPFFNTMQFFNNLINVKYLERYLRKRAGDGISVSPRQLRYRRRYKLGHPSAKSLSPLPLSIQNLIYFVKNRFSKQCSDYKMGRSKKIWIPKIFSETTPRSFKKEPPDDLDEFREITILNRVDLFLLSVFSNEIRQFLVGNIDQFKKQPSRIENIYRVVEFINNCVSKDRVNYIVTDIIDFGNSFDVDKAKKSLLEKLKPFMDEEDIELFDNVYNSLTKATRSTGNPFHQLLSEWALCCFEQRLSEIFLEKHFVRYGEDILITCEPREENNIYEKLNILAEDTLGDRCEFHKIYAPEIGVYDGGPVVSIMDRKGIKGDFKKHGVDFCGYHYRVSEGKILIGLRLNTFVKIAERIRKYTNFHNLRFSIQDIGKHKLSKKLINNLNLLWGFYPNEGTGNNRFKHSSQLGINDLFRLPDHPLIDKQLIIEQIDTLNHLAVRRLRHLHMRNVCGENNREYREKVDKVLRKNGLLTLKDATNRHPN